jgi:hypothetical protein
MTTSSTHQPPSSSLLAPDDYVVIGLATCFVKAEGGLCPIKIAEPIPSAALEALVKGVPTSYELATATRVGAVLLEGKSPIPPAEFPAEVQLCEEFAERVAAAARTYKQRQVAQQLIPLGTTKQDFNYSTERRRLLNPQRLVRTEDNVKQHAYTHQVL